jgi:hypothetical protein
MSKGLSFRRYEKPEHEVRSLERAFEEAAKRKLQTAKQEGDQRREAEQNEQTRRE